MAYKFIDDFLGLFSFNCKFEMKALSPLLPLFLQAVSALNVGDGYKHPIEGISSIRQLDIESRLSLNRP